MNTLQQQLQAEKLLPMSMQQHHMKLQLNTMVM
jgi:hypothetical protein